MKAVKVVSGASVRIDTQDMPTHRVDILARQTCRAVWRFFEQPGVKEDYERWLAEYKKAKEA